MNNITYNIDKLPLEVVGMIYFLFKGEIEGYDNAYMVEIKLDNPIELIKEEKDNFIIHRGNEQYQSSAIHLWDEEWAVLYKPLFFNKITDVDEKRFRTLLETYFETGTTAEEREKIQKKEKDDECEKVCRKKLQNKETTEKTGEAS
jgi:hypothetical protein